MPVSSKLILSSVNPNETRIDTFEVTCPVPVWYELLTHRLFCRNASSTRAVPLSRMYTEVYDNPAIPTVLTKYQKGMMANEPLNHRDDYACRKLLGELLHYSTNIHLQLDNLGVSKQDANLVLLPFIHFKGIVTATEWNNFFALRNNEQARPDMRMLADSMQQQYLGASPKFVDYREFHLPYVTDNEKERYTLSECLAISSARCCRVSFRLNMEDAKNSELASDISRRDSLIAEGHWSPLEHPATPLPKDGLDMRYMVGQYVDWMSYRKFFPAESNKDVTNVCILTGDEARRLISQFDISLPETTNNQQED